MSNCSALLDLPAELRIQIFELILRSVRCRRPLIVLDSIYVNSDLRQPAKSTAILLTCRSIHRECLPILYDDTPVEVSLRSEEESEDIRASFTRVDSIINCRLLPWLRHLELEISFDAHHEKSISRATERMVRLVDTLNDTGKLKTLSLIFFQQGRHYQDHDLPCNPLAEQAAILQSERLLGVSRNIAAKYAISTSRWMPLRKRAVDYNEEEREQFQEICLDYWDRAFPNGREDNDAT